MLTPLPPINPQSEVLLCPVWAQQVGFCGPEYVPTCVLQKRSVTQTDGHVRDTGGIEPNDLSEISHDGGFI